MQEKEMGVSGFSSAATFRPASAQAYPEPPSEPDWLSLLSRLAHNNQRLNRILGRLESHASARDAKAPVNIFFELEQERARIATALHAGAGQPLAGIRMNLDIVDPYTSALPPDAQEAIGRLHRLAASALAEVRAVSHRLHPPDWQTLSSAQALRQLLDEIGIESCFPQTLIDIRDLPAEPDHASRIAIYRCAQECISNVIRHAGATRLQISLIARNDMAELRVSDNGRGITSRPASGMGLGLSAIRRHAESVGGTCDISSSAEGTSIIVSIPLSPDV